MKILYRIIALTVFTIILVAVIAYARGYRFNPENNKVTPTGIMSVISWPKAASIYINGELKGVTDTNLTLPPGKYTVTIKKEGYTAWEKTLVLKGELVESAEAVLFPINPSLSPLTNIGITKAIPVEDSDLVLLFSQNDDQEKDGVYLYDANNHPINLLPPLKLLILKSKLAAGIDFSQTRVTFSPDLKQALVDFNPTAYLLNLNEDNTQPLEVTNSKDTLIQAWEEEKNQELNKVMETFPKEISQIASDSFQIKSFSPDKLRFLYQAKADLTLPSALKRPLIGTNQTPENRHLLTDHWYVYDKKEDRNYELRDLSTDPKQSSSQLAYWFYDSRHLVIKEEKQIIIVEYDDSNKETVYSGPFSGDFLAVTSDGKLLILADLNPRNNKLPDLYTVGIR
ncbi:PEGA domain-containing protein [Patescibacteria group bacterium]|nr:PEGA domain-containing protein [Patescibacteria group bacterium]MCL5091605.1 PEGA domain-containing protein [Patescibacteria group bacterium]